MCESIPKGTGQRSAKATEEGRGGYLLTGWWEFIGLSCQVGQIFQNGLQVGHLPQHVDLMILQTHTHTLIFSVVIVDSWALKDDEVVYSWFLNHHTRSTDQYRLQHADKAAVACSFFY